MMKHHLTGILVGILLILFAGLSIGSALSESLTYDEIVHMQEGENALIRHTFLIDTYNPPLVRELATIPLVFGAGKLVRSANPNIQALPARSVIIALGLMLSVGVLLVAKRYFGIGSALVALLLFVFDPNILANSHYVTLDIGGALFFFLAYMAFVRFLTKPTTVNSVIFGLAAGCMAASKITSLPFFAVSAIAVSFFSFGKRTVSWFWNRKTLGFIALCITLVTIWATYFFKLDVVIVPSVTRGRLSERLSQTAAKQGNRILVIGIQLLKTEQIPLGNYVAVLKNTVLYARQQKLVFFWGRFYSNARWYYILVNALVKTSIPLMILFLVGVWFGIRDKHIRRSVIIMLIPAVSIILLASAGHMLPWVRYLLPMMPFFIIIAATSVRRIKATWSKILFLILLVWYIAGTLSFYPNFISYTNEFISRNTSYRYMMDSNLDWGQSLITFAQYAGTVKPSSIRFSYFGRDDAARYGFPSKFAYGSYKEQDICAFHEIDFPGNTGQPFTAVSISNWYYCGYYTDRRYSLNRKVSVVGQTVIIFP